VVLGWLDAIKFVNVHSDLHHQPLPQSKVGARDIRGVLESQSWYGNYWVPSFAHRARLFWDLARTGWDSKLCRGGMNWNPRLQPYKNAITNELWIAASVSMYLHFPGDNITSPWSAAGRDRKYLLAAIGGYNWLKGVNMTNSKGLYVDGYHVNNRIPGNTKCDVRDETVYTYNQGVILTGLRGLWTATSSPTYLVDGHDLIQSVIAASGWDLEGSRPVDDLSKYDPGKLPPWHGLGRGGIMEELCDASGGCSQDSQTFKGIFFHHFKAFCSPIEPLNAEEGMVVDREAYQQITTAHDAACQEYKGWVEHNAKAALATRNSEGLFGMWWGAGIFPNRMVTKDTDGIPHSEANASDYRTYGLPDDGVWAPAGQTHIWTPNRPVHIESSEIPGFFSNPFQQVLGKPSGAGRASWANRRRTGDPNSRGRGRTCEVQHGGLTLLRAWWDLASSLASR
jgi:hypothetical protein